MLSCDDYVKVKYECDDNSNLSNSFTQDDDQTDTPQTGGELFHIKTLEGGTVPIYLRAGNRMLFGSGKYFYIEHTTANTDYQKENTGIACICHSCGTRIKGSLKVSSNFICHLKNKHPELYQDFLKQKAGYSAANNRPSKRASFTNHRNSPYQTVPTAAAATAPMLNNSQHNNNNEKQEQFHHNVLKFLISTNQSYNVVQEPSFVKLFEFLDFPMQMRSPDYYEQVVKDACDYKKLELYHTFNNCRAYVCNSIDAWCYAGSNYVAIACHWIDDHYQRQSTILTCRRAKSLDQVACIQNEILQRNGIVTDNITASPSGNLQSFQNDFLELGILKDVFAQEFGFVSDENIDNLEFLALDYRHLIKLDIQKLTKIWGHNFVRKLSDNLKIMHTTVMEKCSHFWIASLSKDFQSMFQSILNEQIARPQLNSLVSFYHAIKQLVTHTDKLEHIFCVMQKTGFTPVELRYLAELQEVFEPLSAAFAFLDMSQNHYYGCFLPTLVTLKWKLTRLYNSNKLEHLQEPLMALKEELLNEFKDYYDLDENKSEAILAALTYPPVKTRFIMGLKDNSVSFRFQPQTILRKYGSDFHIVVKDDKAPNDSSFHYGLNSHNHMTASTDFFDFGDSAVDAEELRDVNISKKELTELMAELFGDLNEGLALDTIELETPRKFLFGWQEDLLNTPNTSPERLNKENLDVSRQLNFTHQQSHLPADNEALSQSCMVTSSNSTQQDISFHPDVMSTPSTHNNKQQQQQQQHGDNGNVTLIPVALPQQQENQLSTSGSTVTIPAANLNSDVEFIAVPIPGQPNHFQLAKIVNSDDNPLTPRKQSIEAPTVTSVEDLAPKPDVRYDQPYETNYSALYISLKRHAYSEFKEKFDESLKQAQVNQISSTTTEVDLADNPATGFSKYQYDLLQQQMRIHVQMLTQTYVQTYCHPTLWKLAKKPEEMLSELQTRAQTNNNFKIWNLEKAITLMKNWQQELDEDTEENKQLMAYMHRETELTNHNSRQIPRFHPRMFECFLQSNVFMYPEYLPRMPFSPKVIQFENFSPVESYLIAMGLEKHMKIITENKERIPHRSTPLRVACKRLSKDTIRGKSYRIVWSYIMRFKNADFYNPIKYYFEHNKAPPVEYTPIIGFENNTVLPPIERVDELPIIFKKYLEVKNAPPRERKRRKKPAKRSPVKVSEKFKKSFLEFVREAVGEDITLPENCETGAQPDDSASVESNEVDAPITKAQKRKSPNKEESKAKRRAPENLTINVNYVFGPGTVAANSLPPVTSFHNTSTGIPPPLLWWNATSNCGNSLNTTQQPVHNQSLQCTSVDQSVNSSTAICAEGSQLIEDIPPLAFNFNLATQTLEPCRDTSARNYSNSQPKVSTHHKKSSLEEVSPSHKVSTNHNNSSQEEVSSNHNNSDPEVSANHNNSCKEEDSINQNHNNSSQTVEVTHQSNTNKAEDATHPNNKSNQEEVSTHPNSNSQEEISTQNKNNNSQTKVAIQPNNSRQIEIEIPTQSNNSSEAEITTQANNSNDAEEYIKPNTHSNTKPDSTEQHVNKIHQKDHKPDDIKAPTESKKKLVKGRKILDHISKLNRNTKRKAEACRKKRRIKQSCQDLINTYQSYLENLQIRFKNAHPIIQRQYRKFKALELYTNLLISLREICKNKNTLKDLNMTSSSNSPSGVKRSRNVSAAEDESSPSSQRMARKINRQEENFRHMLMPDTPEETNRKDAIYAVNFYEKVEEAFRSSNRPDDCKKFNTILKSFDPKTDKVSELYYKLEKLFLPDHPELAQVFLTFILPSEAAEIGKFFEHFMITNMATFINKLNIYFNNQPAQIRKIYNCLNELADDPEVTMKKLEAKIVPLLKGNQFLIDWFMQQFPQNPPPERLFGNPEHIQNLKEQQSNRTGEYVETITDLMDSPTNDNQTQPACQLRYIHGRMFYGSKMLLPAKLSFMAASYKDNRVNNKITSPPSMLSTTGCVHAIRERGEKLLQAASENHTPAPPVAESIDDYEKSEEDDVSKQLVIDTTAEEDDSCSSIEVCDENTFKAHALRLNPTHFCSSSNYSASSTSTPNFNSNYQSHHPNAKKTSLNFNEHPEGGAAAGKTSPRKNTNHQTSHSPSNNTCSVSTTSTREKRKSPTKKTKSPVNNAAARSVRSYNQPMVVIHETSSAIQCAKRLKTLVESTDSNEESLDTKEHINIIARAKSSCLKSSEGSTSPSSVSIKIPEEVKQENSDDLEFLPEHPSVTRSPFPSLKMDTDSNEEDGGEKYVSKKPVTESQTNSSSITATVTQESANTNAPWTRDEDKIILIEMKLGCQNREELCQRIAEKLPQRTMSEITGRHQFLVDFLSKLQRK